MVNGRAEGPHPSPRTSAFAGGCAGFVSSIVTCPLDVIKTRLQAQAHAHPAEAGDARARSVAHLVQRIWHDDGIRGFYRGLAPTLIGYLPTWAIYFCVYDTCKRHLAPVLNRSGDREFGVHIMSALLAGSFSTLSTSPLWVVKTRFMLQSSKSPEHMRYRSTWEAFRLIYSTEGLRGFYRGLVPSLLGVSHVVVQFPLYEFFKRLSREHQHKEDLSSLTILLCSGGSKMLASITTYPHEAIGVIARNEGIRGFYRGMGVNLIRTVPNSGLTILTYELIMRYVTLWSNQHSISL